MRIKYIFFVFCCLLLVACGGQKQTGNVFNIMDFGAAGDGLRYDFYRLRAVVLFKENEVEQGMTQPFCQVTAFRIPADHFPPFHRRFSAFPFLFRRFLLSRIFTFHAPFSCPSSVRRLPRRDCCSSPCVGGRARPAAPCAVAAASPPPPICAFLTYICVLCDDVVVFLLLNHIIYDI